jgi:hypothetical protein
MSTVRLKCAGAQVLFYEPDGLLLSSSLTSVDEQHRHHLLAFHLSYLGPGSITVTIAIDGGTDEVPPRGPALAPDQPTGVRPQAQITTAELRGADEGTGPDIWPTSVLIPDSEAAYRFAVWGQALDDSDLRGELVATVSGVVPLLTVTTRAGVTRDPVPAPPTLPGTVLNGRRRLSTIDGG